MTSVSSGLLTPNRLHTASVQEHIDCVVDDLLASLPRIEANMKEATALNVNSTPTFFINGRVMVGLVPGTFTQAVNEAIADAGKKK